MFDPSWRKLAIINAGKDSGLKEGMFAIDTGFLVGKVVDVENSFSRLMLVDVEFNLAVYVGNNAGLLSEGLILKINISV